MSANSIFGRFVVDFSYFLSFCKVHHQGVVLTCTTVVCMGLYVRNVRRTEQRLLEAQRTLTRECQTAMDESAARLNQLMSDWAADGERKDQQLTRLHAQNIQQTRSLDRIMSMLQTCRVEVPNLPSFAQMRSSKQQQQQQLVSDMIESNMSYSGNNISSGSNNAAGGGVVVPALNNSTTMTAAIGDQNYNSANSSANNSSMMPQQQQQQIITEEIVAQKDNSVTAVVPVVAAIDQPNAPSN